MFIHFFPSFLYCKNHTLIIPMEYDNINIPLVLKGRKKVEPYDVAVFIVIRDEIF